MAESAPQDERRAHPRAAAELPARVIANGAVVEAQSVNLSEGGVLLAGTDFPSSRQVKIEIELAEMGWHALDAEVVRHDARVLGRDGGPVRRGGHRRRPRGDQGVLRDPPRRGPEGHAPASPRRASSPWTMAYTGRARRGWKTTDIDLALRQGELLRQAPEADGAASRRPRRRRAPRSAGPASASRSRGRPTQRAPIIAGKASPQAGQAMRTTRPPASGTRLRVAQDGHGSSRVTGGAGAPARAGAVAPGAVVAPPLAGVAERLPGGVGALGDLLGAPALLGVAEAVGMEGDQQEAPRVVDLLRRSRPGRHRAPGSGRRPRSPVSHSMTDA